MQLHEIISISEKGTSSILLELLHPYKRSLYTYFKDYYCSEPVLIITDVMNAAQYGFIAPANEMHEAISTYLQDSDLTEQEKEEQTELICFQSIMLKDF